MGYRYDEDRDFEHTVTQKRIKDVVRRGTLDEFLSGERARVNVSVDDAGVVGFLVGDVLINFGEAVRVDDNQANEVIVLNIGGDDEIGVVVAGSDAAKVNVLESEPMADIEKKIWSSDNDAANAVRIRLLALENEIRLGNLNGNEKELAYLDALQSLYGAFQSLQLSHNALGAYVAAHYHDGLGVPPAGATQPPYSLPPNNAVATIAGTSVTKAE